MLNVFAWVMFFGIIFFIFIQLYAWAAFIAFTLLILLFRDINTNLCEMIAELKSHKTQK
jgi:hypothetical protein